MMDSSNYINRLYSVLVDQNIGQSLNERSFLSVIWVKSSLNQKVIIWQIIIFCFPVLLTSYSEDFYFVIFIGSNICVA